MNKLNVSESLYFLKAHESVCVNKNRKDAICNSTSVKEDHFELKEHLNDFPPLWKMRIVQNFKSCFPGNRQAVSMKNVAKRAIPSCCVESCPYIK